MIRHLNQSSMIDDSGATGAELVEPSGLDQLQRAEIDVQVATAKRWPRQIDQFKKRAIALATIDEETAESCLYRRPVGKDDKGKAVFAEGMSIRMAEIVGASYGNLRVAATIVEQTERKVVARGMAFDLEANFASSSEVVEATVRRNGAPYDERMRVVIAKAALAKARRDATFQVVPRAIAKPIEEAVRQLLLGNTKSLEKRRAVAVSWISKLDIGSERVYAALGVHGPSELTAEELEKLTGLKTAIKDGEVSIDEAFPEIEAKIRTAAGVKDLDSTDAPSGGTVPEAILFPATSKGSASSVGSTGTGTGASEHEPSQTYGKTQEHEPEPPVPNLPGDVSRPSEQPVAIHLANAPGNPSPRPRGRPRKPLEPQAEMPLTAKAEPQLKTTQQRLADGCEKYGITFEQFRKWLIRAGFQDARNGIANVDSIGSFDELPEPFVRGLLRSGELLYAEVLK